MKKGLKKNGMKKMNGNDSWNEGFTANDQDWSDGYWATEELYHKDDHEYGYFQKKGKGKGKERKARKARMMKAKEVNQEMEKASPTMTSNFIGSCHSESDTTTGSLLFCSIKFRAWFSFLFKLTQHVLMC